MKNNHKAIGFWAMSVNVTEVDTNGDGVVVTQRAKKIKGSIRFNNPNAAGAEAMHALKEAVSQAADQGISKHDLSDFKLTAGMINKDGERWMTWEEDFSDSIVFGPNAESLAQDRFVNQLQATVIASVDPISEDRCV